LWRKLRTAREAIGDREIEQMLAESRKGSSA
jgi:hypothetical protein